MIRRLNALEEDTIKIRLYNEFRELNPGLYKINLVEFHRLSRKYVEKHLEKIKGGEEDR